MKPGDILLTLTRTGQFSVRYTHDHARQCGPTMQTDVLTYEVELTMTGEDLDQQGFVVDNNYVAQYFHDTYHEVSSFVSCERIAMRACIDLKRILGDKLIAVKCVISGFP